MTTHPMPARVVEKPRPLTLFSETAMLVATRRPAYDAQRINMILNDLESYIGLQRKCLRHHGNFRTAGEEYTAAITRAAAVLDERGLA